MTDSPIYKDAEWLEEKYHGEGLTTREMGDIADCGHYTILKWMKKHEIPRRKSGARSGRDNHRWNERVTYDTNGEYPRALDAYNNEAVYIHRLSAVAWFGIEEVKENQVHHLNGVKWDNREDNLEAMEPGEHISSHWKSYTEVVD